MNCIWNLLLLILIVNYSHGRSLARWSTTTDEAMIEECLQKALSRTHVGGKTDHNTLKTEVTNIICQTQISNGINIKLSFDLHEVRWECTFYKSFVKTLDIQYEKCDQIDKESAPEEAAKVDTDNQDEQEKETSPEEAKADAVNQDAQEKESLPDEEDDEAKIDAANQRMQENENQIKTNDEENSDHDNNANQNLNAEQKADNDDDDEQQEQQENEKVPEENVTNHIEPDE